MSVLLGCIADDFTGASDLASTLATAGMRTVQVIGVPSRDAKQQLDLAGFDAVVVALATRTMPVAQAVAASVAALDWLKTLGVRQTYFKYCSTFDSTDAGNIGPVADALLEGVNGAITVVCPAFPDNKRTVYLGHLFVGDRLLSDSPMRHHPLTPMTDADLVRVLGKQTKRRVGLIPLPIVHAGAQAITREISRLREAGVSYAVVDAVSNADLEIIAAACAALPLVTASSGVARGLPRNFIAAGSLAPVASAGSLPRVQGAAAVLAGSCSEATRRQVAEWSRSHRAVAIDPLAFALGAPPDPAALAQAALDSADRLAASGDKDQPVLFYSSASPQEVASVQDALGRDTAATLVESTFARLATALVARGVRRLVVAGGETSGAVVKALGVRALSIGPAIAPGVPWTMTVGDSAAPPLALALKSGNFGQVDFFTRALEMLS